MFWCKSGCGKKVKKHQYRCPKCSKKAIQDNGLSKANGNLVYGLYDQNDELVYVGVTNSAVRRVAQHLELKRFKRMEVIQRFGTRSEAEAFEIFAIWHLRPPLNIKIEEPSKTFNLNELDAFGKVATEAPSKKRACQTCGTILNQHNNSLFCLRHRPKPTRNKKKQDTRQRKKRKSVNMV